MTVLFCDLVDSTPLAERLDPEDLREVFREYREICSRIICRFEGYLARHIGDGILVYFGYPQAHEDDARRAVQAALGMLEAIQALNARLEGRLGAWLRIRIGIHTGLVVAGDLGEAEHFEPKAIVGQTPNIAARLQGFAQPDGVIISGATQRLVEGYFHYEALGPQALKGVSQPVPAYRVLHESTARSRLEAAPSLTSLIGRAQELRLLSGLWKKAASGRGQAVALIGEAGIGKSRIAQALKEHVAQYPDTWLTECACSPLHRNSAFYPIIDLLERVVLEFGPAETADEKRAKVEAFLVQYGVALREGAPLLASLLSLPPLESDRACLVNPQLQKQKTLELLAHLLITRARQQPVLLVVEDLHWADPSTQEFLALLLKKIEGVRLMGLLTSRAELAFFPQNGADVHALRLGRLAESDTERLVGELTQGKRLPPEVLRQILEKTDGIPLYVEEFTRMLLESGQLRDAQDHYELIAPLPAHGVPATLQDSLMARLDRLSEVKMVAQATATLGREFRFELLLAVSPIDEPALRRGLRRLVEADLLHQRGELPDATFQFKHVLLQEAAYQSLLKTTRQHYHEKIARALVERFPQEAENRPELPAHHYTEAGKTADAVHWWRRAGERAFRRSANLEAVAHLKRGLELLETLPAGPERVEKELALLTALGPALISTRGFGGTEVGETYHRIQQLCDPLDDSPEQFIALGGLFMFHETRGDLQTANTLAEQLLRLAQKMGSPEMLLRAHNSLSANLYFQGELERARYHALQGHAHSRPEEHHALSYRLGQEHGSLNLCWIASILLYLGFPDQALAKIRESLVRADEVGFAFTRSQILVFMGLIHIAREDWSEAAAVAEESIAYSSQQFIPNWLAWGLVNRGYAMTRMGNAPEGLAVLRQGTALYQKAGGVLGISRYGTFLAEALGAIGEIDQGLSLIDDVFRTVDQTGEHVHDATLCRIRAELLLRRAADQGESAFDAARAEAERWLRRAVGTAQAQKARMQGVTAANSLARLLHEQGRDEAAAAVLADALNGLTEGFAVPSVREARERLGALRPAGSSSRPGA